MSVLDKILSKLSKLEEISLAHGDELLTLPKAAEFLKISKGYVYQLTRKHLIPCHKRLGKKILFSRTELYLWVMDMPSNTGSESSSRI